MIPYIPLALKCVAILSGMVGVGNLYRIGGAITADTLIAYIAAPLIVSVACSVAAVLFAPNRDIRRMVDSLLLHGQFDKAVTMINSWKGGQS